MVKVLDNLGDVYDGDATGLNGESNANGLEAIKHRPRKVRNMMNKGVTDVVQQNNLMQQCV